MAKTEAPAPAGHGEDGTAPAHGMETALALFLSVGMAGRLRLETEWLAQKLAGFGHSPTRKDGREIGCGHAFCRDGCAYCWLDAAEKAAGRLMEQKPRRRGRARG